VDALSVRLVKNSVVYPTIRVASHPGKLLMGVYDGDDNYVDDTALSRRSGEQGAPVPRDLFPVVADSDAPEAIYAGTLYFHFGHFLLERLARAWCAHRIPMSLRLGGVTDLAGVRARAVAVGDPRHPHDQEPQRGSSPTPPDSNFCTFRTSATATTTGSTPSTPSSWAATRGRLRFLATGFGCRAARSGATSATSTRHRPSGGSRRQGGPSHIQKPSAFVSSWTTSPGPRSWRGRKGRHSTP
jgi:hypothetical protein